MHILSPSRRPSLGNPRAWITAIAIAAGAGATGPASAGDRGGWDDGLPKAAGVMFGEPTGLSGKYWIGSRTAIDAGFAYSFDDYVLILADHLWHFPQLIGRSSPWAKQILPYAGVGGLLYFSTDSDRAGRLDGRESTAGIGLRLPLGVEWRPERTPIGVFLELAPGMYILPETAGLMQGGLGVRYYFEP